MVLDETKIGVVCVDDNPQVAEALRLKLSRQGEFNWKGWLPDAGDMLEAAREHCPEIILMDVDMPGRDPFEVTQELARECPDCRVIFFSGHVRVELIDRALESGAWGYVAKHDGEESLLQAIKEVAQGGIAFSPQARAAYDHG